MQNKNAMKSFVREIGHDFKNESFLFLYCEDCFNFNLQISQGLSRSLNINQQILFRILSKDKKLAYMSSW